MMGILPAVHALTYRCRRPVAVSPYAVVVVGANKAMRDHCEELYSQLSAQPLLRGEVVLDDRWGDRLGMKLTEAELVGIPNIVVVGRSMSSEGKVELHDRQANRKCLLLPEELQAHLLEQQDAAGLGR